MSTLEKNNPMISVIIPIYNSEKYLKDCINSLVNQSYSNLQIILVDDGSTDESPQICDSYKDDRIFVIHKKNGGVNSAREAGLQIAKGDYITFVDADDVVDRFAYELIIHFFAQGSYDMIVFRYHSELNNHFRTDIKHPYDDVVTQVIDNKDLYDNFMAGVYFGGTLWNKVWKRETLTDITFRKDIFLSEDSVYVWDTLKNIRKALLLDVELYHYRVTLTNATNGSSVSKYLNSNIAWDYLIKEATEKQSASLNRIREKRIEWILKAAKRIALVHADKKLYETIKKQLKEDEACIKRMSAKDRLSIFLIMKSWYRLFYILTWAEWKGKKFYFASKTMR